MSNVVYLDHPLIKHKITMLRRVETGTGEFRNLVEEIAMLMGYEALSDLKTTDVKIRTPLEETVQPMINGRKLAVVVGQEAENIRVDILTHTPGLEAVVIRLHIKMSEAVHKLGSHASLILRCSSRRIGRCDHK